MHLSPWVLDFFAFFILIYLSFVSEKGILCVSDMFLLVVVIDLISKLYIYALYTLFWHGLASAIYILSRFYL